MITSVVKKEDDISMPFFIEDDIKIDLINQNDTLETNTWLSAEDAYNLARDTMVIVDNDIIDKINNITLTRNDLINISEYSPNVNYLDYIKISKLSEKDIISIYPELKLISGINLLDMKYYHMAMMSNDQIYIDSLDILNLTYNLQKNAYYLSRGRIYYILGDVGKTLLDKIYGSVDNYIRAIYPSILEDLVISIDENIQNSKILLSLADNYGISLIDEDLVIADKSQKYDIDYIIRNEVYNRAENIIDKIYSSDSIDYNPTIMIMSSIDIIFTYTIKEIINMTYLEYLNIYPEATIKMYSKRLYISVY